MKIFKLSTLSVYVYGLIITLLFGGFITYSLWKDNPYDELLNPATNQINIDSMIISIIAPALLWTILFIVFYGIMKLWKIVVR
jgi:hypothetical protein